MKNKNISNMDQTSNASTDVNLPATASWTYLLATTDVVRIVGNGESAANDHRTRCSITKVSN